LVCRVDGKSKGLHPGSLEMDIEGIGKDIGCYAVKIHSSLGPWVLVELERLADEAGHRTGRGKLLSF